MSTSRNNSLDLMRLVAALLVLFSHCYPLTGADGQEPFARVMGYETGGGLAVSIFFIISGYLIAPSFLRSKSVYDYVLKRVFRIFPGLIVAVCLTLIVCAFFSTHGVGGYFLNGETYAYLKNIFLDVQFSLPGVFAGNAFPNTVNGSLWTLPFEACMYVVVLLLGIALSLKFRRLLFVTMAAYAFCVVAVLNPGVGGVVVFGIAHLAAVAKLAVFFLMGSTLHFYLKSGYKINSVFVLIATLIWVGTFGTRVGSLIYMVALPFIIVYLSSVKVPEWLNVAKHGDISYGVYIYAFPIQQIIIHHYDNHISIGLLFVKASTVTISIAILSWIFIEKPALNYVHALVSRHKTKTKRSGSVSAT